MRGEPDYLEERFVLAEEEKFPKKMWDLDPTSLFIVGSLQMLLSPALFRVAVATV